VHLGAGFIGKPRGDTISRLNHASVQKIAELGAMLGGRGRGPITR
jgi:hypothetical protein